MTRSLDRRQFTFGTGALLSVAALGSGCGGPYVNRRALPGDRGGDPPIVTALRFGITAPSPHNTQPWRFELLSELEARLFVDPTRLLPHTDPPARQIHIGHGTLLETVAIAASSRGHRAEVTVLPDGEMPPDQYGARPTAHIRLIRDDGGTADPLFGALGSRRTSRLPHEGPAPTRAQRASVEVAAGREGVVPRVLFEGELPPILDIVKRANVVEVNDRLLYGESLRWFRFSRDDVARHRDGLNLEMVGAGSPLARLLLDADNWHDEANRGRYIDRFGQVVDTTQALLTLTTPSNTLADWIATGRSYMRAHLAATAAGLHMHPVSQALQEFPQMDEIRAELDGLASAPAGGKLQMLARVGRTRPPAISPRRTLAAMTRRSR